MLSSPWLPRDHKGFQRGNGESGYHRKGPKLYSLKLLPRTCPYLLLFSLTTLHPFCFFIPYPVNSRPGSDGWYSNYRHILSYSQCDNMLLALLPGATASLRMNQTPTSLTQYFVLLGAFFFFFWFKIRLERTDNLGLSLPIYLNLMNFCKVLIRKVLWFLDYPNYSVFNWYYYKSILTIYLLHWGKQNFHCKIVRVMNTYYRSGRRKGIDRVFQRTRTGSSEE